VLTVNTVFGTVARLDGSALSEFITDVDIDIECTNGCVD